MSSLKEVGWATVKLCSAVTNVFKLNDPFSQDLQEHREREDRVRKDRVRDDQVREGRVQEDRVRLYVKRTN